MIFDSECSSSNIQGMLGISRSMDLGIDKGTLKFLVRSTNCQEVFYPVSYGCDFMLKSTY